MVPSFIYYISNIQNYAFEATFEWHVSIQRNNVTRDFLHILPYI